MHRYYDVADRSYTQPLRRSNQSKEVCNYPLNAVAMHWLYLNRDTAAEFTFVV
jgi:hypothetical protein